MERLSLAQLISFLPEQIREELFHDFAHQDWDQLEYDWSFWARPQQLPPPGAWFCWFIMSGRGFGKTRTGSEWVIDVAYHYPQARIALIAQTVPDARDVMVLGESGVLARSPSWFYPKYTPSKRLLEWPNGAIAKTYTGEKPEQLRGPQHTHAWVDELAKFQYPDDTWDNMELGLRLEVQHKDNPTKMSIPQVVCTTTPKPINIVKELRKDAEEDPEDVVLITGSTYENIGNLAPTFKERIVKKYEGTRLGLQELYGYILDNDPNALWDRDIIDNTRVSRIDLPRFKHIAIGVDPPAGVTECGIVVVGLLPNYNAVILEDLSRKGKPHEWGGVVVDAYNRWLLRSDNVTIIAEKNQGGDMVEHTIRSVAALNNSESSIQRSGQDITIELVHASKGKTARAEPISALYYKNWIHHGGTFGDLEDEQCTFVQGESDFSPNRVDALVWGCTFLMLEDSEPALTVYYYQNPFFGDASITEVVDKKIALVEEIKRKARKNKNGNSIPAADVQDVQIVRG